MPIYDKSVRKLMQEMIQDLAPQSGQLFSRDQALEWFRQKYPKIKRGTVSAHLVVFSTNAPSRVHHTFRETDDLLFQVDRSNFRLYEPSKDPPPIRTKDDAPASAGASPEEDEATSSGEFAYERDLRDFLTKNLTVLEPGLRVYQEEGISGVEFPAGGRFIDILAHDIQGALVVIELKVSRGYDRVVGQILRYMAWIERNLAEPDQSVRRIIVGREISEDLELACTHLSNVLLFEYELSVALKRIVKATKNE